MPSYRLKAGDEIQLRERSKDMLVVQHALDTGGRTVPEWLEVLPDDRKVVVRELPSRAQIDVGIQEQLIVELYSK